MTTKTKTPKKTEKLARNCKNNVSMYTGLSPSTLASDYPLCKAILTAKRSDLSVYYAKDALLSVDNKTHHADISGLVSSLKKKISSEEQPLSESDLALAELVSVRLLNISNLSIHEQKE